MVSESRSVNLSEAPLQAEGLERARAAVERAVQEGSLTAERAAARLAQLDATARLFGPAAVGRRAGPRR